MGPSSAHTSPEDALATGRQGYTPEAGVPLSQGVDAAGLQARTGGEGSAQQEALWRSCVRSHPVLPGGTLPCVILGLAARTGSYPGPVPAAGKASWASQGLILVVALGIEPVSKRPAPLRPVYRPPGPPPAPTS